VRAEKTSFQEADLWRAQFVADASAGRPVKGADLRDADLRYANLQQANLQGANMAGAMMEGAELSEAQMDPEDVAEARRQGAKF
jgi:uncharacterized protein YjbI with pentapeptide repeats